eukprot:gene3799-6315_t
MADVSGAQDFLVSLSDRQIGADPILSLFKRQDLEGSLAATANGKFVDYWTVEKLADFNNVVDSAKDCPAEVKAIFTGSKNPRLRASKLGTLIINHALHLKSTGQLDNICEEPSEATSMGVNSVQTQPTTTSGTTADGVDTPALLRLSSMQRYEFHPSLPEDCQLRVRDAPVTTAETLGVVTRVDEIFATAIFGDWIQVELPGEAWMMRQMEDTILLVPASEPPLSAASAWGETCTVNGTDPLQGSIRSQTSARTFGALSDTAAPLPPLADPRSVRGTKALHGSFSNLVKVSDWSVCIYVVYHVPVPGQFLSRLGSINAAGQISSADQPQTTPRDCGYQSHIYHHSLMAYQMLEMRVSRLEQELSNEATHPISLSLSLLLVKGVISVTALMSRSAALHQTFHHP